MNYIFRNLLNRFQLKFSLVSNSRWILSNSGGQDSISLFYFCKIIQIQGDFQGIGVYFNHLWQRDSTPLTLNLVNLYYTAEINFISPVATNSVSTEQMARIWRYNNYDRLCFFTASQSNLLGHTNTDQLETFLFNLFRGSGLGGLISMRPERKNYSPQFKCFSDKKVKLSMLLKTPKSGLCDNLEQIGTAQKTELITNIIRPLLALNRYEVQILLKYIGLPIWTDKTNFQMKYRRNRIRFELLPIVRFYMNPNIDVCILRCMQIIEQENDYFKHLTDRLVKQNLFILKTSNLIIHNWSYFRAYPELFQKRILFSSIQLIGHSDQNSTLIESILKVLSLKYSTKDLVPNVFQISKTLSLIIYYDCFILYEKKQS